MKRNKNNKKENEKKIVNKPKIMKELATSGPVGAIEQVTHEKNVHYIFIVYFGKKKSLCTFLPTIIK